MDLCVVHAGHFIICLRRCGDGASPVGHFVQGDWVDFQKLYLSSNLWPWENVEYQPYEGQFLWEI